MAYVIRFSDVDSSVHDIVGGKGANLGLLSHAGFEVPSGFTVTTEAYRALLSYDGLADLLADQVASLDYENLEKLELQAADIRSRILAAEIPAGIAAAIEEAYAELGGGLVAVRSSGTAEDLGEASFAGMHDTFLDVKGPAHLIEAIKGCWASLFTGRATAYRQRNGFDHLEAALAVVVQTMVEAEVSGVMFTGNPLSTATDEMVINGSWGLGEAVVQGLVTPDEYIVAHDTLTVRRRTLGTKRVQIVRDPVAGAGTVTEDVPDGHRSRFVLTDDQASQLAALGRRVQTYYGGFPQDTEWAFAGGEFFLLQSRPITGVEFSWDNEVLSTQVLDDDDDVVWTRAYGDEIFNGALTPLTYSIKMGGYESLTSDAYRVLGFTDLAKKRRYRFYKASFYYNCEFERETVKRCYMPSLRSQMLHLVPKEWQEEVVDAPFSWATYLKTQARILLLDQVGGVKGMFPNLENWRTKRRPETEGLPPGSLTQLSDDALERYIDRQVALDEEYVRDIYMGGWIQFREAMSLLAWMVTHWYKGDNDLAFIGLITGVAERTDTQRENHEMWKLSEMIRDSEVLTQLFAEHRDGAFFEQVAAAGAPEVARFHEAYTKFLTAYAHRGHADRDLYYPRRPEDPSLDYRAFKVILSGPSEDPEPRELEVRAQHQRVYADVVESIRQGTLGPLKVELFKLLYDLVQKLLVWRDNERQNPADLITMSIKRGCAELGHRLHERGATGEERDFYFLSKRELYDLFEGRTKNLELMQAKIAARKRDFDRYYSKEWQPPMYLQHGRPVTLADIGSAEDGVFVGLGTSRGLVTGTARVIKTLAEIGRVKKGEILVVNSTDPGWTPVFLIVSGIVAETGGMLAHFSCLSREYGLPAVQLESALQLIPDGATIEVNGDTGVVTVLDEAVLA